MKKFVKFLAMLLALVLVFSLLSTMAIAEGEEHVHCLCGTSSEKGTVCAECKTEAVAWTAWDGTTALKDLAEGNYYLTTDIEVASVQVISRDIAIDLCGHDITGAGKRFMHINGVSVSLVDCTDVEEEVGQITGFANESSHSPLNVSEGGVLNIYGGKITGNTSTSSACGVISVNAGTTLNMFGGEISGNTVVRGTVKGATGADPYEINILGGTVTGNHATGTGSLGGGAGVYSFSPVTVGGDAKVFGNTGAEAGKNQDVFLRNDSTYTGKLVLSADKPLEKGAQINYGTWTAEANEGDMNTITGTPSRWKNVWVSYNGQKVGYQDGAFFIDNGPADEDDGIYEDIGGGETGDHIHCLCGKETAEGATCASCGGKAVAWTAADSIPTVPGHYFLTAEVSAESVSVNGEIAICLHGQKIESTAGGNIFDVKNGGILTITDCRTEQGSVTGATSNSAILVQKGGAVKLYGGKLSGNHYTNGSGTVLLHQGDATTNGGAFYMYGGEISGNTNLRGTIFTNVPANATNKTAIVQILGGKITGNTATQTSANMGGGAAIYAFTPVVVGGDAVIAGNDAKVNADDIYLRHDGTFTATLVISADVPLKDGADIHYGSNPAEADLADLQYIIGEPSRWADTWVTYNEDPVGYADGAFFTKEPVKHIHCLCGAEQTEGNTCALCGTKAVEWTAANAMPTAAGHYYLNADLSVSGVGIESDIAICLHGHNIKSASGGYIINVKTGGELTVTDCQDEQGSITGATTNSALWVQKGGVLNLYNGKISGNHNTSSGGSGTVLLHQGDATTNGGSFYMYGGEISGNTNLRGAIYTNVPTDAANKTAILQILGGTVTDNTGTQTSANMGGGAGIYSYTPVVIGGSAVIAGNDAKVNADDIYLRNDGIFTGKLVVSADVPLTAGANIHYGSKNPDNDEDLQYITGTPDEAVWDSTWVTFDGAAVKYKDGKFYTSADIVISNHDHDGKSWVSVTEETTLLPNKTGYFVLDGDVALDKVIVLAAGSDVHLCLNGHTLTAAEGARHFDLQTGSKLTICDCTAKTAQDGKYTAGKLTGGTGANGGAIIVRAGAQFDLYDGIMCDNTASNNGGFIYVEGASAANAGAAFHMYGGMICDNYGGYGAAVRIGAPTGENAGTVFVMEGGIICHNESPNYGGAFHAAGNATIDLIGGVIEENIAAQGGGGLSINGASTVNLSGTIIRNNTATTWAGGIYIKNGAIMNMTGGEISGNSSKVGAGVLVENTGTTMNLSGGAITGNKAGAAGGGGIYASTNTVFCMTGGTVSKNTSETSGGGIILSGAKGSITGGEISENTSAGAGAGIALLGSETTLGKVTISKNTSATAGGGVYVARAGEVVSNVVIDGAVVTGNTAKTSGGGMFVYMNGNTVTMKTAEVTGNSAQNGGGILVQRECTFTMEGGEISGNTTTDSGAGFYASIDSTFIMNGGTISGNWAEKNAGGLYVLRAKAYLNDGAISGNTANAAAGGVYINGSKAQLNGTSITCNHSENSSGGGVMVNSTTAKVDGVATRFAGRLDINGGYIGYNTTKKAAGGLLVQAKDTVVNMYGGKISNNTATKFSGGVYVGKDAMFNMHGGAVCYNVAETDVAGGIRHDAGGGNYTGGEVYGNTCARSGGGIVVGGTNNKVTMKNLKIYENFAKIGGGLVHQSNGAVLEMEDCEIYNNTVSQDAAGVYVATYCYYFANNCHIHDNVAPGNGGGVYSWATSNVYLTDCLIENNEAKAQGGGVWTRGDAFCITGCTIRNNTASGHGGGVCTGMMGSATHVWTPGMQIKDTLFENNTSGGIGGGLYLSGGAQGNLRDVTFTANAAAAEGGAFWAKDELNMHSVTATGNKSGGEGYAVYLDDSDYDGHSYMAAVIRISGNMKIHDNPGGDLYLGEKTGMLIGDELLGEDTKMVVTLHSGLLTQLVWGAYNYEGGNQQYTITYGDRSMTDPEIPTETDEPVEDPTQQGGQNVEGPTDGQQKNEPKGKTGLIVGIAAVAAVIVAAAVILVAAASKKKKVTK